MKDDIILPPLHYDELPEPDDPTLLLTHLMGLTLRI